MRVIELEEILAALDEREALAEVAQGFQRYTRGETQVPAPIHLPFGDPPGIVTSKERRPLEICWLPLVSRTSSSSRPRCNGAKLRTQKTRDLARL
jgi:hypothetical protein